MDKAAKADSLPLRLVPLGLDLTYACLIFMQVNIPFPIGFFDLIDGDETYLEREPLERATKKAELFAYKHTGFWKCMDMKRDKDELEVIYKDKAPWLAK